MIGELGQRQIQIAPTAQDAGRELVRQSAVASVESAERPGQCRVKRSAGGRFLEDLEGGASRADGFGRAQSSIPRVGLDGTATSRTGIRPAR